MRRALGTAVFSGMLGVTLFGIFLTPVFFLVIDRAAQRVKRTAALSEISTDSSQLLSPLEVKPSRG